MITPQLKELIDSINKRHRRQVSYKYADGHKAVLSVLDDKIIITSDNSKLVITLGKILEKILSGDVKGALTGKDK